jgi:hypothetical protein
MGIDESLQRFVLAACEGDSRSIVGLMFQTTVPPNKLQSVKINFRPDEHDVILYGLGCPFAIV